MRCAIYARVSTAEQTCQNQIDELKIYAAARGWTLTQEYVDAGVSGVTESRPALDALLRDARRRKFDGVLVWSLDRVGRSLRHLLPYRTAMSHPLDDCVKKIDRAKEHILEIHNNIQPLLFKGLDPHPIRISYQFPPGDSIFLLRGTPPPIDKCFTIFAGECVHQLRSTLDHLVYQLIIQKTKTPPTFRSAFPIVGKGHMKNGSWVKAADEYIAKTSRLKQAISVSAEALIHDLQPYQRGAAAYEQDPLWQLSELDNA